MNARSNAETLSHIMPSGKEYFRSPSAEQVPFDLNKLQIALKQRMIKLNGGFEI